LCRLLSIWARWIVRRNNFILGKGGAPVKVFLVHCTTGPLPHGTNGPKCNKMKHLKVEPAPHLPHRTAAQLM
jgi:hypothetical protein